MSPFSFTAWIAVLVLQLAVKVHAHGQIVEVTVDGTRYPGFNTYYIPDENNKKTPVHRLTPNEIGYVRYWDVRSDKMACSESGLDAAPVTAPVKAGGQVKVQWVGDKGADKKQWPHPSGPVISYMARCEGPCASFDARQAKFFKIEEFGLDTSQRPSQQLMDLTRADNQPATGEGLWGASKLMQDNSLWTVNIPKGIADGEYILRHEVIALQWVANANEPNSGAQYYPSCIQLAVTGGGSDRPEGVLARDLYTVEDGIFDLYKDGGPKFYKVPGPPIYTSSNNNNGSPAPANPAPANPAPANPAPAPPSSAPSPPAPAPVQPAPATSPPPAPQPPQVAPVQPSAPGSCKVKRSTRRKLAARKRERVQLGIETRDANPINRIEMVAAAKKRDARSG